MFKSNLILISLTFAINAQTLYMNTTTSNKSIPLTDGFTITFSEDNILLSDGSSIAYSQLVDLSFTAPVTEVSTFLQKNPFVFTTPGIVVLDALGRVVVRLQEKPLSEVSTLLKGYSNNSYFIITNTKGVLKTYLWIKNKETL